MKLEDMPVVTAEQVMRFRQEAIAQCNAWRGRFDAVQGDHQETLANWKKTIDQRDQLSAQVEGMREALDQISGLCRHMRHGGPDPMDLQELHDALDEAVTTADNTLAETVFDEHSLALHDAALLERLADEWVSKHGDDWSDHELLRAEAARIRAEAGVEPQAQEVGDADV